MVEREGKSQDNRCIQFCVGIDTGEFVIDGNDIPGDGVNVVPWPAGLSEPRQFVRIFSLVQLVGTCWNFPMDKPTG
jgi:hypothetical protein